MKLLLTRQVLHPLRSVSSIVAFDPIHDKHTSFFFFISIHRDILYHTHEKKQTKNNHHHKIIIIIMINITYTCILHCTAQVCLFHV